MFFVSVEKLRSPEFAVAEKILLAGPTAGVSEPLHVIKKADVIETRIIVGWMRGRSWNNRRQMHRKFLGRRPLIKPRIRPAPHCHFSVTKRLLRQPFDYVVTIAWFIGKRLKLSGGIPATTNIDQRKDIAMRREVCPARVVRVRDVRRQCKDDRGFRG